MKKLLVSLIALLSICMAFSGCGKNKGGESSSSPVSFDSSSEVASSESESESSSEVESSESESESSSEVESSESESESSSEVESSESESESASEAESSEEPVIITYTVTFDCDGLFEIPLQEIVEGGKAQEPSISLDENYVFEGWEVNGVPFDFDTVITEDTEITLVYSRLYTVTFDCSVWEGLSIPAQKVKEGETLVMPKLPASQEYEFKAWLLDGVVFDVATPITADITLTLDCEAYGSIV